MTRDDRLTAALAQIDPAHHAWLLEAVLTPAEQRARRLAERDRAALAVLAPFTPGRSPSGAAKEAVAVLSRYLGTACRVR